MRKSNTGRRARYKSNKFHDRFLEAATDRTFRRDRGSGAHPGDVAALTNWIPRTGLGWEAEHFIVYFAATIVLSLASRRPYVVAVALMIFAGVP